MKFITKIDWKNADGFRKLPLVPEDLASYDVWKDNIGQQGKMLGPLFHYSGFLRYIMNNSHYYSGCALQKNTKNTPLHPGLMHSHVPMNVVTYLAKRGGRINVLYCVYCRILH